jgi:hypothetical protein
LRAADWFTTSANGAKEQECSVRTVNVDALINELSKLAPRRTLELEMVGEAPEDDEGETTGAGSEQ